MSKYVRSSFCLALVCLVLGVTGCSKPAAIDAQKIEAYRTSFMLGDEPDAIMTVADVRSTLLGTEPDHENHDHDGAGKPDHDAGNHDAGEHDESDHEEDHDAGHDSDDADHGDEVEGHDEDGDDHDGHDDHEGAEHGHAHEHESRSIAMVGHVGGLANPWSGSYPDYPFAKAEATFFLADPQAVIENEEAGHKHAPGEECAFCAAHAADNADMIAVVNFVDESGKVLKADARTLFNIKENDTVVVKGKARIVDGGILVVEARGLYIRN